MRRFVLPLLALVLAGALTTPVGAATGPQPADQVSSAALARQIAAANRAAGAEVTYVRDTLAWIRNNVVGVSFGPSKRTGYGKATVTAIVKGCPECDWYRAEVGITNHQPTSPATAASCCDWCWPWEFDMFSDRGCWNAPSTWNWGAVWDWTLGDAWHPWDQNVTSITDKLLGCWYGSESALGIRVAGKGIVAGMAEEGWLIKLNDIGGPYEWAVAAIGGCVVSLNHK